MHYLAIGFNVGFGILGVIFIYFIGYFFLVGATGHQSLTFADRIIGSAVFFFINVVVVFLINFGTNGALFSNRLYFFITISAMFFSFLLLRFRNYKQEYDTLKHGENY